MPCISLVCCGNCFAVIDIPNPDWHSFRQLSRHCLPVQSLCFGIFSTSAVRFFLLGLPVYLSLKLDQGKAVELVCGIDMVQRNRPLPLSFPCEVLFFRSFFPMVLLFLPEVSFFEYLGFLIRFCSGFCRNPSVYRNESGSALGFLTCFLGVVL